MSLNHDNENNKEHQTTNFNRVPGWMKITSCGKIETLNLIFHICKLSANLSKNKN